MDFALSSSTVLGAAVLLWLLWVAPYLLRRRRAAQPAGEASMLMDDGVSGTSGAPPGDGFLAATGSRMPAADTGTAPTGSAPAGTAPGGGAASASGAPGRDAQTASEPSSAARSVSAGQRSPTPSPASRLRIRWGRLAVAAVGLMALVACPIALVLVAFGGSILVPFGCAGAAFLSVAVLRTLAVRERRRRVDAAFSAAMRGPASSPPPAPKGTGSSEVFDAGFPPEPAPRPLSREELRAAALEVAKASQASAEEAAKASGETAETWEPIGVPKPSYVEAARAERPEPEPLEAPEEPKPSSKTAIRPKADVPEPGSVPGVPALTPRPAGRPTGALGNLDAVLQRRRA